MLKESKIEIVKTCQKWVETFIINLNLCPFAKKYYVTNKVRFSVIDEKNGGAFLEKFGEEIEILEAKTEEIETTLLIIPAFGKMEHFLAYLKYCEETLKINHLETKFMLVPFHPFMRHKGLHPDSPKHFTSLAPYPIVHILRKKTVDKLGAAYEGDVQVNNDKRLKAMGTRKLQTLWQQLIEN